MRPPGLRCLTLPAICPRTKLRPSHRTSVSSGRLQNSPFPRLWTVRSFRGAPVGRSSHAGKRANLPVLATSHFSACDEQAIDAAQLSIARREDQRRRARDRQLTRVGKPGLGQPTRDLVERVRVSGLGVYQHVHREDQPAHRAAPIRVH